MFPLPAHQTKDISPLNYPLTPFTTVQLTQKSPLNSVSTGTTLYLSSQLLAHYIQETLPKGTRAIELGAGTGLVSIALGLLGWKVWSTDLLNVIDDVLRDNIARNWEESAIVVQELDWCDDTWKWIYPPAMETNSDATTSMPEFDLIACADGLYAKELIDPLLKTLVSLSGCHSPLILVAFERRDSGVIDLFFEQARSLGFTTKKINLRRILGRQLARWGWATEDYHSAEIWSMRCKP
jgi:predicted nicotinamide N-methyase